MSSEDPTDLEDEKTFRQKLTEMINEPSEENLQDIIEQTEQIIDNIITEDFKKNLYKVMAGGLFGVILFGGGLVYSAERHNMEFRHLGFFDFY